MRGTSTFYPNVMGSNPGRAPLDCSIRKMYVLINKCLKRWKKTTLGNPWQSSHQTVTKLTLTDKCLNRTCADSSYYYVSIGSSHSPVVTNSIISRPKKKIELKIRNINVIHFNTSLFSSNKWIISHLQPPINNFGSWSLANYRTLK